MNRRGFITAGSGLTVAAAAAALSTPAAAGGPHGSPTVFDFGAVGDGSTDDSGAFIKALEVASDRGLVVQVPSATYAVKKPISWVSTRDVGVMWGLQAQGATIRSRISGGGDVLRLQSHHTVRYFRLTGGLSIVGSGEDGCGLHILALSSRLYFYNFIIDGLSVERAGTHGGLLEGDVFECTIANSYFQDNRENGLTLANSKGGVISTVNLINCFFNQNGNFGLATINFDGAYGGPTDVRVYGGYARDNKNYGFYYNNGTGQAALHQVGFENNCRGRKPGDPDGAHVYAVVSLNMKDCAGYNEHGGATYLVKGWFTQYATLEGCRQAAGQAMAATGKSRLIYIDGKNSGHVYMDGCGGGFDVKAGAGITWEAKNCTGPSPAGPLNIRGTMTGTA